MSPTSTLRTALGLLAAAVVAFWWIAPAGAQTPEEVHVKVGKVATFPLPRQPLRLASENPSIATIQVLPDGRVRVTGKKVGNTRIVGRDQAQVPIVIRVVVSE